MKFLDLFTPIVKGNFGLTEEAVYKSIQLGNTMIPLWGGNQDHSYAERYVDEKAKTKYNEAITVFEGEGIIISLDGSAGSMSYKKGEKFALNHHAGFFKSKGDTKLIYPEFFSIFFQEQLREASISEGSKTLTLEKIYAMDFEIPSIVVQEELMTQLKYIIERKISVHRVLEAISSLKNKILLKEYRTFQFQDLPIKNVFDYLSGNSGLTEQEIYQKVCWGGEKYEILSGSTSENRVLGKVPVFYLNGKKIKIF